MNAHDATIAMMKISQSMSSPSARAAQSSKLASIVADSFWHTCGLSIEASSSSPRSHAEARQTRCASTLGKPTQNAAHHTKRVALAGALVAGAETASSCARAASTGVLAINEPADASRKRSTERDASASAAPLAATTVPLAAVSVDELSNRTAKPRNPSAGADVGGASRALSDRRSALSDATCSPVMLHDGSGRPEKISSDTDALVAASCRLLVGSVLREITHEKHSARRDSHHTSANGANNKNSNKNIK